MNNKPKLYKSTALLADSVGISRIKRRNSNQITCSQEIANDKSAAETLQQNPNVFIYELTSRAKQNKYIFALYWGPAKHTLGFGVSRKKGEIPNQNSRLQAIPSTQTNDKCGWSGNFIQNWTIPLFFHEDVNEWNETYLLLSLSGLELLTLHSKLQIRSFWLAITLWVS